MARFNDFAYVAFIGLVIGMRSLSLLLSARRPAEPEARPQEAPVLLTLHETPQAARFR